MHKTCAKHLDGPLRGFKRLFLSPRQNGGLLRGHNLLWLSRRQFLSSFCTEPHCTGLWEQTAQCKFLKGWLTAKAYRCCFLLCAGICSAKKIMAPVGKLFVLFQFRHQLLESYLQRIWNGLFGLRDPEKLSDLGLKLGPHSRDFNEGTF